MRSLPSLLFLLIFSPPASAFAQSIVDTGDVIVDVDDNLIVGSTAPGSRLIDGADDGPYANIDLASGFFQTPNSIIVDNGGSLTSLGDLSLFSLDQTSSHFGPAELAILNGSHVDANHLSVGNFLTYGVASVRIESGSTLHSVSANIRSPGGPSFSSVSVVGPNSSWITDGAMSAWSSAGGTSISIEDGAYGYAGSTRLGNSYDETTLAVIGAGSVWETGDMSIETHGIGVEILDGGQINSGSVWLSSQTYTSASVNGEGSSWNIDGSLSVLGNAAGGSSSVGVSGGALLWSRGSAIHGYLGDASVGIGGQGSTWWSGDLSLSADRPGDYASVQVSGGGLLISDAVTFSGCNSPGGYYLGGGCAVRVDGAGSRWFSNGPVSVAATATGLSTIDITDRAVAVLRDDVTIGSNSQLNLDKGLVVAPQITIAGGELRGTGAIIGDVVNSGSVAPGDTATGDIGRLLVEGDYIQSDDAVLDIQLGGAKWGESDILSVLGTSVLDGELNITLAEGYLPEHGDTFYIVSALQRLGEFNFVSGLDLGTGLTLDLSYTQHFVVLTAVDENWIAPGVPEPGAALLFAVGFVVVRRAARRKAASIH